VNYFDRVPMRYRPCLEAARTLIPDEVRRLIEPRFLFGVSPRFVGLHHEDMGKNFPKIAARGWTYDDCAHACFAHSTPDEQPTVVFPKPWLYPDPVKTILHEYGHLFDEATGFHLSPPPTTDYSWNNRYEAVAEAFAYVLIPPSGLWDDYMRSEEMRPLRAAMGCA
jgi:hypothetical protein